MSQQDHQFLQEPLQEDNMLHLSTAAAVANSTKRHSPLSPHLCFKTPTLYSPPSPSSADYNLFGFTKLQLPLSLPSPSPAPAAAPSPLRRTISEPIHPADNPNSSAQLEFLSSQLPENPNRNIAPEPAHPLPAAAVYGTFSDPNRVMNRPSAATPPCLPVARNLSRCPTSGESPSKKRLKRRRERMKEMSKWWNRVITEGEEEDDGYENYSFDNTPNEESENEMDNNPSQEAVWVEKNGECLVIHFKCPCGNGYQILLSGNNCYYKLPNM